MFAYSPMKNKIALDENGTLMMKGYQNCFYKLGIY